MKTISPAPLLGVGAVVTVVLLGSLTGCVTTVPEQSFSVIGGSTPLPTDAPADVSPRGVIRAAKIIASGDIASAIANGTVTATEAATAQDAIANGTLDQWYSRAVRVPPTPSESTAGKTANTGTMSSPQGTSPTSGDSASGTQNNSGGTGNSGDSHSDDDGASGQDDEDD